MKTTLLKTACCLAFVFACTVCPAVGQSAFNGGAASTNTARDALSCVSPGAKPAAGVDEPVAIVAGQPIYERDLADAIGAQMLQIRQQEYQIKSKALDELIRRKVLETEAKKRGISVDKLQEEVDSKVPDPSDAEVAGYYLAVKNQIAQSFQEIKPQLQKAIKLLKIQQARQDYADSLRGKTEIAVMLRPPRTEVNFDPARVLGDPRAPVTIVAFSDFQCPYCSKAAETMRLLVAKYNGKVKVAFRDFPMRTIHPRAQAAAEAARCAGDQGKFWEFHDALFAEQSKLDEKSLIATAQKLGLEGKLFQSCLSSGKSKVQVEEDVLDGTRAGVAGTPGFFINGAFVNGSQPQAEFEKLIDAELAAIKARGSSAK